MVVAELAVRDVAQLTARYFVGGGDRPGGYVRGVVEGWRGRGAGGGGSEDAVGLPVAAPTAAAAAPAPAPPAAAIGLLLATSLATMDEGAGVAWRLPRGAGGLCGSGGGGGRRYEAGGLAGVRLSASRACLGTVAITASPGWEADALRGGRLGRACHAQWDMKKNTNAVHKNISTCQVKRDAACFKPE